MCKGVLPVKVFMKNVFKYRYLLEDLTIRDLKVKYRRSLLGILWSVLNPLLMMLVITAVFSSIFKIDVENFPIYYLTGSWHSKNVFCCFLKSSKKNKTRPLFFNKGRGI